MTDNSNETTPSDTENFVARFSEFNLCGLNDIEQLGILLGEFNLTTTNVVEQPTASLNVVQSIELSLEETKEKCIEIVTDHLMASNFESIHQAAIIVRDEIVAEEVKGSGASTEDVLAEHGDNLQERIILVIKNMMRAIALKLLLDYIETLE